jgi:hypothetical protein
MSKQRMTVKQYVVSFADRAEKFEVPAHRAEGEVSQWQERQIARLTRIADKLDADVSEFGYEPADFADADYILKGMSGCLRNVVSERQIKRTVERVIAHEPRMLTAAEIGQMVLDGKLGKVAAKRAAALVS